MKTAKHKGTYDFHPGTLPDRIPAYNTKGTEYKRVLPPLRNQKVIAPAILTEAINKIAPRNNAEYTGNSIKVNDIEVIIGEGIANCKKLKFRFKNVVELLENLRLERVFTASLQELRLIKNSYYQNLNEPVNNRKKTGK